jgi:hypothetical protein
LHYEVCTLEWNAVELMVWRILCRNQTRTRYFNKSPLIYLFESHSSFCSPPYLSH